MKRLLAFAAIAITLGLAVSFDSSGPPSARVAALNRVLESDMSVASQDLPQGVPTTYDWAQHPRLGHIVSPSRFDAFTAWGQLYQCAGTAPTPTTKVQLDDLQAWVLLRGARTWRSVQASSDLQGAAFPESYVGTPVAAQYLSRGPRGTSVELRSGYNFHFWPGSGRIPLQASDVIAIVVTVRARLSPSVPERPPPCLVLSVGGDMWTSPTAVPDAFRDSGDVGIGRFKRVGSAWRLFTMSTASPRVLQNSPLPLLSVPAEDY